VPSMRGLSRAPQPLYHGVAPQPNLGGRGGGHPIRAEKPPGSSHHRGTPTAVTALCKRNSAALGGGRRALHRPRCSTGAAQHAARWGAKLHTGSTRGAWWKQSSAPHSSSSVKVWLAQVRVSTGPGRGVWGDETRPDSGARATQTRTGRSAVDARERACIQEGGLLSRVQVGEWGRRGARRTCDVGSSHPPPPHHPSPMHAQSASSCKPPPSNTHGVPGTTQFRDTFRPPGVAWKLRSAPPNSGSS
jgi:hypothetical protein